MVATVESMDSAPAEEAQSEKETATKGALKTFVETCNQIEADLGGVVLERLTPEVMLDEDASRALEELGTVRNKITAETIPVEELGVHWVFVPSGIHVSRATGAMYIPESLSSEEMRAFLFDQSYEDLSAKAAQGGGVVRVNVSTVPKETLRPELSPFSSSEQVDYEDPVAVKQAPMDVVPETGMRIFPHTGSDADALTVYEDTKRPAAYSRVSNGTTYSRAGWAKKPVRHQKDAPYEAGLAFDGESTVPLEHVVGIEDNSNNGFPTPAVATGVSIGEAFFERVSPAFPWAGDVDRLFTDLRPVLLGPDLVVLRQLKKRRKYVILARVYTKKHPEGWWDLKVFAPGRSKHVSTWLVGLENDPEKSFQTAVLE